MPIYILFSSDLPEEMTSIDAYAASLGHKVFVMFFRIIPLSSIPTVNVPDGNFVRRALAKQKIAKKRYNFLFKACNHKKNKVT